MKSIIGDALPFTKYRCTISECEMYYSVNLYSDPEPAAGSVLGKLGGSSPAEAGLRALNRHLRGAEGPMIFDRSVWSPLDGNGTAVQ